MTESEEEARLSIPPTANAPADSDPLLQEGSLLRLLGHDMLGECMRHLGQGYADADAEGDDANAGCAAASCSALLHASLGSGAARLRLDLGTADIPW